MGLDQYLYRCPAGMTKKDFMQQARGWYLYQNRRVIKEWDENDKVYIRDLDDNTVYNITEEEIDKLYHVDGSINSETFYWRKCNFLHRWVLAVSDDYKEGDEDNCVYFEVTLDQIKQLVNDLKQGITLITGKESLTEDDFREHGEFGSNFEALRVSEDALKFLDEHHINPMSGFFFGSCDMDKYYLWDLWRVYTDFTDLIDQMESEGETSAYYEAWY